MTGRRVGAQTVAGQVVDSATRRPVGRIVVGLVDTTDRWVHAVRTDTNGVFYADAPLAGVYRVVLLPAPGRLFSTPHEPVGREDLVQHAYVIGGSAVDTSVYLSREVDDSVVSRRDAPMLVSYPAVERDAGRSGWVSLVFVVDTAGRVERPTLLALAATNAAFAGAAGEALAGARFRPALRGGHPVRQWLALTIDFDRDGVRPRGDVAVRYGTTVTRRVVLPD